MAGIPGFAQQGFIIRLDEESLRKAFREELAPLEEKLVGMQEVMNGIASLQAAQTETLKDVLRLIQQGDTTAAETALGEALAKQNEIDAAVEAAAPEPVVVEPVDEEAPVVEAPATDENGEPTE